VLGVFTRFLWSAHTRLPGLLGLPEEPLAVGAEWGAREALAALSDLLDTTAGSVGESMLLLLSLVLLRLLLRNAWAAIGVFLAVAVGLRHLTSTHLLLDLAVQSVVSGLTLFVALRVGLVALMSMWFFETAAGWVDTLDPSSWLWGMSVVNIVAIVAVAAYAAVVALGGRALLQDDV
jgi:hypothetical protein